MAGLPSWDDLFESCSVCEVNARVGLQLRLELHDVRVQRSIE